MRRDAAVTRLALRPAWSGFFRTRVTSVETEKSIKKDALPITAAGVTAKTCTHFR